MRRHFPILTVCLLDCGERIRRCRSWPQPTRADLLTPPRSGSMCAANRSSSRSNATHSHAKTWPICAPATIPTCVNRQTITHHIKIIVGLKVIPSRHQDANSAQTCRFSLPLRTRRTSSDPARNFAACRSSTRHRR